MPKQTRQLRQPGTTAESRKIAATSPDHTEVARLAYLRWLDRGCPIGSPEEDWSRAEQDLKSQQSQTA